MAARLYVGNLPYSVTEDELRNLFSGAGTVESVSLPKERETGRARGFGFVDMATSTDAENAIRMFDGYNLSNRTLRVQPATERPQQAGTQHLGSGGGHRRR